jgi:putative holliday junction resolvase
LTTSLGCRTPYKVTAASTIAIEDLPPHLERDARLLGLDVGTKTIGMALSDVTRSVATPFDTIRRTKFTADAKTIREVVEKNQVGALVIGFPLNLDGSEGPRAQSTRAFARNLAAHVAVPMVLWDERLSTAAVERHLIEADASRKRRAEVVDRMAAAYILQGALDRLRNLADR